MNTSTLASDKAAVTKYINDLERPLSELVTSLRKAILSVDKKIGEQIKWGAPCFFYNGYMKPYKPKEHKRDIVVITTHRGYALLVFPSGSKIEDTSGLLEGDYKDGRRIASIFTIKEAREKKKALQNVIKKWLRLMGK